MKGKILLISPPDFFENSNQSIFLGHISEEEQDIISEYLSKSQIERDINFYVYTNEENINWFLYAINRCEYKYINIDTANYITHALAGYVLSRTNTFYSTSDDNLKNVYSYINSRRVNSIEQFLESILGAQTG